MWRNWNFQAGGKQNDKILDNGLVFSLKLNMHQPYKPGIPIIHLYKDWCMNVRDSFIYFNQNMKITSMSIMKVYR